MASVDVFLLPSLKVISSQLRRWLVSQLLVLVKENYTKSITGEKYFDPFSNPLTVVKIWFQFFLVL